MSQSDIECRERKFRPYHEPEKRGIYEDFKEYHGPGQPPSNFGSPGDVYMNTEKHTLWIRLPDKWKRWKSNHNEAREKGYAVHPKFTHCYLWIVNNIIDYVKLEDTKKTKIMDEKDVIANAIKLLKPGGIKRKANPLSRNAKRFRVPPPENLDSAGPSSAPTVTSILTPPQHPPPASPVINPDFASSMPSASTVVAANGNEGEMQRRILELEVENAKLRARDELMNKLQQMERNEASPSSQSPPSQSPAGLSTATPSHSDENSEGRLPQLQSPPPTPSLPDQACSYIAGKSQDAEMEQLNGEDPLLPRDAEMRFVGEERDIKPEVEVEVKEEPVSAFVPSLSPSSAPPPPPSAALTSASSNRDVIDLTLDSDDDELPLTPRPSRPLSENGPQYTRTLTPPTGTDILGSDSRNVGVSTSASTNSNDNNDDEDEIQLIDKKTWRADYRKTKKPERTSKEVSQTQFPFPLSTVRVQVKKEIEVGERVLAAGPPQNAPNVDHSGASAVKDEPDESVARATRSSSRVSSSTPRAQSTTNVFGSVIKDEPEETAATTNNIQDDAMDVGGNDFDLQYPDEVPMSSLPSTEDVDVKMEDVETTAGTGNPRDGGSANTAVDSVGDPMVTREAQFRSLHGFGKDILTFICPAQADHPTRSCQLCPDVPFEFLVDSPPSASDRAMDHIIAVHEAYFSQLRDLQAAIDDRSPKSQELLRAYFDSNDDEEEE